MATKDKLVSLNGLKAAVDKIKNLLLGKQDKLTAGTGISISNNTISSTDYSTLFVLVDNYGNDNYSLTTDSQNLSLSDIRNAFVAGRDVVLSVCDRKNGSREYLYHLEQITTDFATFTDHTCLGDANPNIRGFFIYSNASGKLSGVSYMNEYLARTSDLSSKQNTISDLATIRSGAAKGATALQSHQSIKTINNTSLVGSGNVSVQPVISDLATIRSNASNGNTALTKIGDLSVYGQPTVVDLISNLSNIITREINVAPSLALRKIFVNAGAVYNESTGYYEMNGLTDITEDEMVVIYNMSHDFRFTIDNDFACYNSPMRTNFPLVRKNNWTWYSASATFSYCNTMEVVKMGTRPNVTQIGPDNCFFTNLFQLFYHCGNLRRVIGVIQPELERTNVTDMFYMCRRLEDVQILGLKQDISFAYSPNLSFDSINFMINNNAATSPITITLHSETYMRYIRTISSLPENISLASA